METTVGRPKALLVYKSVHHENTARIARAMADVLGAECASPLECPYERLASCSLLGLGSGIYYGRVHDDLWQWVQNLPEKYTADLPVFIFTTSGLPVLAKLWHWPLKSGLMKKGYDVVAEFSCRGFDTWGPLWLTGGLNWKHPDERDIQRVCGSPRLPDCGAVFHTATAPCWPSCGRARFGSPCGCGRCRAG